MCCYYCTYLSQCPYKFQIPCFNQFAYPSNINRSYWNENNTMKPYFTRWPMDLYRFSDMPSSCSDSARPPSMTEEEIKEKVRLWKGKNVCIWTVTEGPPYINYEGVIISYDSDSVTISTRRFRPIMYRNIHAIKCMTCTETTEIDEMKMI